jgi:hypothetical protein
VRYVPPVDVEGRRKLMAEAAALLCPTQYVEPLRNVALKAQASGTPVICTDWGEFSTRRVGKMYEEYYRVLLDLAGTAGMPSVQSGANSTGCGRGIRREMRRVGNLPRVLLANLASDHRPGVSGKVCQPCGPLLVYSRRAGR